MAKVETQVSIDRFTVIGQSYIVAFSRLDNNKVGDDIDMETGDCP